MNKADTAWKYIGIGTVILAVIILIPVLLNYILLCNTPRGEVIGKENGPIIWLDFWGAYLAAIGSFIMAVIAFYQAMQARKDNKKMRMQNAKKAEYDAAKLGYDMFEKQIINDIKLYSISKFTSIYRLLDYDISVIIQAHNELFQELQLSSIVAVKYKEDQAVWEYINILCNYNHAFLKYSEQVKALLVDYENGVLSKEMLKEHTYAICKEVNGFCENTEHLSSVGFDTLLKKNAEVVQLLKEVNA